MAKDYFVYFRSSRWSSSFWPFSLSYLNSSKAVHSTPNQYPIERLPDTTGVTGTSRPELSTPLPFRTIFLCLHLAAGVFFWHWDLLPLHSFKSISNKLPFPPVSAMGRSIDTLFCSQGGIHCKRRLQRPMYHFQMQFTYFQTKRDAILHPHKPILRTSLIRNSTVTISTFLVHMLQFPSVSN